MISGMPIKDIKRFLDWCQEGDASLQKRRDLFYERKEAVEKQLAEIKKVMDMIRYKCWYYDTALEAGTERVPGFQPVPWVQYRSIRSGRLRNALYSELCPLDSVT